MMAQSSRVRRAWAVYVVYCFLSSAFNLGIFLFALWARLHRAEIWPNWIGQDMFEQLPSFVFGAVEISVMAIGAFFCVGDIAVLFAPKNDKGWVLAVVNIALGLGSVVFTPLCLWLVFQWLAKGFKDEFREPVTD